MASIFQACPTRQNLPVNGTDQVPDFFQVRRRANVYFKPGFLVREPLTPLDFFPFSFRHYLPWAFFFHDNIEFLRLVEALHTVAHKYLLLCGRLCEDETGRYFLEVGSFPERKYDFPVVEMCVEMSMAKAILRHGRLMTKPVKHPIHPDTMPFYLDSPDMEAIHKGQDPFLKVKLTHFSDGCCLAISVSHVLMDGMRFAELFRDISRAYCGNEVSIKDIKREYMMLEGFSKHFSEEDKEGCAIPKTMLTGREPIAIKQYLNEAKALEILYFSKELIDDMKSKVTTFIPKGSFVSTADIMQALIWMLGCEMNSDSEDIKNSTDLDIVGTMLTFAAEIRLNGFKIIPDNYLGNALYDPVLIAGEDLKSKSLLELLAALALLTRQKQIEIKTHPKELFKMLIGKYIPLESTPEQLRAVVSNLCKLPLSEVDFGQSSPGLFFCNAQTPFIDALSFVTPLFHTGGLLLHLMITEKQKTKIKTSSVLKKCAPDVKYLFDDFDVKDLNKLIKHS